jgi:single-strand DNA-binding protein
MANLNKVQLIGRLGKDPEIRSVGSEGKKVANFSLATSEKYKNQKGEFVESTEWHNIVVWGKPAEVVEKYLKKASQIYVEGKLKTRMWEKDGVKHYVTEIFCDNFQMLDGVKKDDQGGQAQRSAPSTTRSSGQGSGASNAAQKPSGDYNGFPWEK